MVKNLLLWIVIAVILMTVFQNVNTPEQVQTVPYSQFLAEVQSDQIKKVETEGLTIIGERVDSTRFKTIRPYMEDPQLIGDLLDHDVQVIGREPEQQSLWRQLLVACFPILIIIAVFMFFMRQMQGGGGGRGGPM
ncbi:MAG: ATP-dependent metallopeptidase FtsH/Yme1/Tma family protein, partial [Gammaproteobacteria bacterium]|nr:ATP-dependent metallopeptidase FtsH/Yme1/Tma family protein [Gammaproteobacteria bacterium]